MLKGQTFDALPKFLEKLVHIAESRFSSFTDEIFKKLEHLKTLRVLKLKGHYQLQNMQLQHLSPTLEKLCLSSYQDAEKVSYAIAGCVNWKTTICWRTT